MDDCKNTCSWTPAGSSGISVEVIQTAETLACLLTDSAAFQNFIRLNREVRLDDTVNEIVSQMNGYGGEDVSEESDVPALEARLEALPMIREYRQAEQATRLIFRAVEEAISGAAGVPFAEFARPKACG